MYRIAVCDDEVVCVAQNIQLVSDILDELNADYSVKKFFTGESLCESLLSDQETFDLLLLDVEISDKNGIEIGRFLREKKQKVSIIIISGYDDYVLEGYDIQAVQYLLKPVDKEKLRNAIQYDYFQNHAAKFLTFRDKYELKSVVKDEVLYIETFYNTTTIHLLDKGKIQIQSRAKALKEQLPAHQFFFCHKSFCVNLDYVREIRSDRVLLVEGSFVPVSKGYYASFRQAFLKY